MVAQCDFSSLTRTTREALNRIEDELKNADEVVDSSRLPTSDQPTELAFDKVRLDWLESMGYHAEISRDPMHGEWQVAWHLPDTPSFRRVWGHTLRAAIDAARSAS